jgi:predicted SAM-dependent methyltransferase
VKLKGGRTWNTLRRSQFLLGAVKTVRGISMDARVAAALVRRSKTISNYIKLHSIRKLHIAASNNLLPGWLNTDISLSHKSLVYMDATNQFPFDNNTFDYILAEHMIEHITYAGAQFMLRECFRVMKPGGRIRVATPDLRVLLALHEREKNPAQREYIEWAVTRFLPEVRECKEVHVINNFFQSWGHQFLYDQETLIQAFSSAGFHGLKLYKPGISEDQNLKEIESHGKQIESEDINQFETIVIEGCKPGLS